MGLACLKVKCFFWKSVNVTVLQPILMRTEKGFLKFSFCLYFERERSKEPTQCKATTDFPGSGLRV